MASTCSSKDDSQLHGQHAGARVSGHHPQGGDPRLGADHRGHRFHRTQPGVTLSTEQSGTIDSISFESGDTVKPDQLLLSLDASVEKANLRASMAKLPAAKAKFDRYQNLFTKGSISRDQLDDTEATYRSSRPISRV